MATLFQRVFSGNDAVYGLTEGIIDKAIEQYGEEKAVSFPGTASLLLRSNRHQGYQPERAERGFGCGKNSDDQRE